MDGWASGWVGKWGVGGWVSGEWVGKWRVGGGKVSGWESGLVGDVRNG